MNGLAAVWLTLGAVWLLAPACKSEPAEEQTVPAESFAATFAKAVCDNAARCCSRASFAFDQANCEGRLKSSFQASMDFALTNSVDYDEVAAGKCLARLDEPQGCGLSSLEFPSCDGLFDGQLADGQPCGSDVMCKSRWCTQRGDATTSVCTPLDGSGPVNAGKVGDDCSASCEAPGDCPAFGSSTTPTVCYRADGLFCQFSIESGVQQCGPLLEIGQPCVESWDCADGLFCRGFCEAPHPNGASCEYDGECLSGACLTGECVESALSEDVCASGGTDT